MERAVLIEHGEFTAAAGASGQPNNNRVLLTMSRFEKEIEHPCIFGMGKAIITSMVAEVLDRSPRIAVDMDLQRLFHQRSSWRFDVKAASVDVISGE